MLQRYRVGVDIGKAGGIALVNGEIVKVYSMPLLGSKNREVPDVLAINRLLGLAMDRQQGFPTGSVVCYVEEQSPRRGQGVVSQGRLMLHYGLILGTLISHGYPVVTVRPMDWKKRAGLTMYKASTPDKKRASVELASRLYPKLADELRYKNQSDLLGRASGLAEALLIQRFGE